MRGPDPGKGEPLNVSSLAAEGREGFRKADLSARLERYGKAKANAMQFARYLEEQQETPLADSLKGCGNYAVFRDYYTIGEIRLSKFCTCKKHLICPLCAIRRGAKALRVYLARVDALMQEKPLLRPFLVTLTVRNGSDIEERFRHLSSSLRSYHKRRKGTRQRGEVLKASSAVWSYEFTNRGRGWHPHVHAVWLCEEAPDPAALSEEWRAITGDSYIVDVRPIQPDPEGGYVSGFLEVFKYAIKFSDLDDADRLTAYKAMRGKRLQDSFGDLRGLQVEPEDTDELLEDLPFIERLYLYSEGHYRESSTIQKWADGQPMTDVEKQIEWLISQGWSDGQITDFLRHYGHLSDAA